jgi:hypothetical protein
MPDVMLEGAQMLLEKGDHPSLSLNTGLSICNQRRVAAS